MTKIFTGLSATIVSSIHLLSIFFIGNNYVLAQAPQNNQGKIVITNHRFNQVNPDEAIVDVKVTDESGEVIDDIDEKFFVLKDNDRQVEISKIENKTKQKKRIVFLLDYSGSMLESANSGEGDRKLDAAIASIKWFAKEIENKSYIQISIVPFAHFERTNNNISCNKLNILSENNPNNQEVIDNFTSVNRTNIDRVYRNINKLKSDKNINCLKKGNQTNLYYALGETFALLDRLSTNNAPEQIIVVLSDGFDNFAKDNSREKICNPERFDSLKQEYLQVEKYAKIKVHTIAYGQDPEINKLTCENSHQTSNAPKFVDKKTLEQIATLKNGKFYLSPTNSDLEKAFEDLFKGLEIYQITTDKLDNIRNTYHQLTVEINNQKSSIYPLTIPGMGERLVSLPIRLITLSLASLMLVVIVTTLYIWGNYLRKTQ
jgi:Mg-chelatase subunit ChlD